MCFWESKMTDKINQKSLEDLQKFIINSFDGNVGVSYKKDTNNSLILNSSSIENIFFEKQENKNLYTSESFKRFVDAIKGK